VITDWDPIDGTKPALGRARCVGIWDSLCEVNIELDILTEKNRNGLKLLVLKSLVVHLVTLGYF
jgi:hypothetical protein